MSANEFSRTMSPERVLLRKTDYNLDIEASEEECKALADRFGLRLLEDLRAQLAMRPFSNRRQTNDDGIQVDGTVWARVCQRCVRTNEDFTVDLEFPLNCLVRPMAPLDMVNCLPNTESQDGKGIDQRKRQSRKESSYRATNQKTVDEMDLLELQRLLQADIADETMDEIMEDLAVYQVGGLLDAGELVSQLFYLQLDPYPKKPGTDFFESSITG